MSLLSLFRNGLKVSKLKLHCVFRCFSWLHSSLLSSPDLICLPGSPHSSLRVPQNRVSLSKQHKRLLRVLTLFASILQTHTGSEFSGTYLAKNWARNSWNDDAGHSFGVASIFRKTLDEPMIVIYLNGGTHAFQTAKKTHCKLKERCCILVAAMNVCSPMIFFWDTWTHTKKTQKPNFLHEERTPLPNTLMPLIIQPLFRK